jgi:hypothetical protein
LRAAYNLQIKVDLIRSFIGIQSMFLHHVAIMVRHRTRTRSSSRTGAGTSVFCNSGSTFANHTFITLTKHLTTRESSNFCEYKCNARRNVHYRFSGVRSGEEVPWRKFALLFHLKSVVKYLPLGSILPWPSNSLLSLSNTTWYSPASSTPTR